jgi:hypothetical protein
MGESSRRWLTSPRNPRRLLTALALVGIWAGCAAAVAIAIFLSSSRTVVVASHDSLVRPTMEGFALVRTGPVLPDFRLDSGGALGVEILLGKTEAASTEELIERYGFIASQPDVQVAKVENVVREMAMSAAAYGALIGIVPV